MDLDLGATVSKAPLGQMKESRITVRRPGGVSDSGLHSATTRKILRDYWDLKLGDSSLLLVLGLGGST